MVNVVIFCEHADSGAGAVYELRGDVLHRVHCWGVRPCIMPGEISEFASFDEVKDAVAKLYGCEVSLAVVGSAAAEIFKKL